ncbi:MAG: aldehyde reductase [Bacteroidota bacterium]
MDNKSAPTVLVTGGSGFLGIHCVFQLLEQGYQVRTTTRSLKRKEEVIDTLKEAGVTNLEQLTFVEADLGRDDNWTEACTGCDYVLHVASPFPFKMPKDENELIKPAVEGTLRVLRAASSAGVKRVVLTSSFAAIGYSHKDSSLVLTEEHWTDANDVTISAYVKSKTLAERAAWNFVATDNGGMELTTICPRFILGPSLGNRFTTSLTVLQQLFDGSMRATPKVSYGIIDVRDVADLHLRAMTHPEAKGQRFLASSGDPMSFPEIARFIKAELGHEAQLVTTRVYPNWLIRLMAPFNPAAKGIAPNLGKRLISQNDKASKLLGWQPRSREEAILASIRSIQAL